MTDTWLNVGQLRGPAAEGGGVTDGDKGDIVVGDDGAVWFFHPAVVTSAARSILSETTTADMVDTLGLGNVDNTADVDKPVFTSVAAGTVPPSGASAGRFLKDDGTWSLPPSAVSGGGNIFPFQYSTTTTEPPTGAQIRGNNATFTSSTKLWIMETTTDGLDVTVGLGRIKAGFQVYVQDYSSSARYALFSVISDAIDKGAYWEVGVALVASAGTIPGGKIALQSLSSAQTSTLFSTTTTAAGLTPGANGGGAGTWLSGAATWTTPTKTTVGLANVDNTSDAAKPVSTATQTALDLKADLNQSINAQTGTSYTLVLGDNGKLVTLSNAAAIALTVPTNASVAFPAGARIDLVQKGAGQVTVGGTPTVNSTPTKKTRAQYSALTLVKEATDTWYLFGDISAT